MEGFEIRLTSSKKVSDIRRIYCIVIVSVFFNELLFLQGKGLFATQKFDQGDVILEEDPLVSCQFAWNAAYRYLACDYCMRYVLSDIFMYFFLFCILVSKLNLAVLFDTYYIVKNKVRA